MNQVARIRKQLEVTQSVLADGLGVTQGNVSQYERGQTVPPHVARRLIDFASKQGVAISYDDIYGARKQPTTTQEPAHA